MSNETQPQPDRESQLEAPSPRAHERAPQLLKRAALLLVLGSLLPWIGEVTWSSFACKLGVLAGCYALLRGARGRGSALWIEAGIIVVALGLEIATEDSLLVLAEFATLLLGGLTYVHIVRYEHGGKFNPLYPLMFAACAVGGVFALFGRIRAEQWLAAVGCAIVTAAGFLAVFTIGRAMIQAKRQGDLKQAEAQKTRRRARAEAGSRLPTK